MRFTTVVPYLHYDDADAAADWLVDVFGFEIIRRWPDETGTSSRNVEMRVGDAEVWLDGDREWWPSRGRTPEDWLGVWVDDVDAMYERVLHHGVEAAPPEDRPWGVRELQVKDPEGYTWGFLQRLPPDGSAT